MGTSYQIFEKYKGKGSSLVKLECQQVIQTSQHRCFSFSVSFSEGIHLLTGPDTFAAGTLLCLLTGCHLPQRGQILFLDYDIFLLGRAYQNHLAYFSRYPLFPGSFPLRHFLIYSGLLQRMSPELAQEKAGHILDQLQLSAYASCPLEQLPKELRRRVVLANTLFSEAPVYLLRRPFALAAPEDRPWLTARLEAIRQSKIVVLSEPDPSVLSGVPCQVYRLENGAIQEWGRV